MPIFKIKDIADEISVRVDDPKTSGYDIFVGLEHYDSGKPVITRYGSTAKLDSSAKVFESGDILIARRNVYLKRAGLVNFKGLTSGDSIVIRAKTKHIQKILPFVFNTTQFWDYASKHADGSMSKRLSPKNLLEFEINLPSDVDEINKLSDLLWSMFESMHSYEDLIAKSDELIKSHFIEMFGSEKNNIKKYVTKKIDCFANCFAGATPSTKIDAYWDNGTIPWMASGEVHQGTVLTTEKKITKLGYEKCSTRMVPINSVVIALAGAGKTRGTVAITGIELCTNQSLCAICINKKEVLPKYLYFNLKNRYEEIRGMCGVIEGRGGLNLKIVGNIDVIVPPLDDQKRFIDLAEQIDKSKFEIEQSLENLKKMYEKVLRENF